MTSVGHALAGLALRNLSAPRGRSPWLVLMELGLFTALANLPDWRLPWWGHEAYHVSHSVFVLALLLLVLSAPAILLLRRLHDRPAATWVWLGLCGAVLSHVLLDAFYAMGSGIALLWPLSEVRLHLPVPWFLHLRPQDGLTLYNLRVCATEAVCFGTVLLMTFLARRRMISYIPGKGASGKLECQP